MDHVLLADAKQYAFTLEKSTILPFVSYNAVKSKVLCKFNP